MVTADINLVCHSKFLDKFFSFLFFDNSFLSKSIEDEWRGSVSRVPRNALNASSLFLTHGWRRRHDSQSRFLRRCKSVLTIVSTLADSKKRAGNVRSTATSAASSGDCEKDREPRRLSASFFPLQERSASRFKIGGRKERHEKLSSLSEFSACIRTCQ